MWCSSSGFESLNPAATKVTNGGSKSNSTAKKFPRNGSMKMVGCSRLKIEIFKMETPRGTGQRRRSWQLEQRRCYAIGCNDVSDHSPCSATKLFFSKPKENDLILVLSGYDLSRKASRLKTPNSFKLTRYSYISSLRFFLLGMLHEEKRNNA